MKQNRHNKRKQKKGCGCKMCKPHKGIWAHFFKRKERDRAVQDLKEVESYGS